jgi:hypothetical protein
MVTDPTGIRERTSGVVDPNMVNALTSDARAQNLRTLGTISTQEAANQGTLQEVVQAGANQLKARAASLMAQAQQATEQANALQAEWERAFQERQLAEEQRQFDITNSRLSVGSGSGGGGSVSVPGLGEVDPAVLDAAWSVINGGDIKNISTAGNLRGKVQTLIAQMAQNPELSPLVMGSVDQLTNEATSKLRMIQEAQDYLNKKTGVTGPVYGGLSKFLGTTFGSGEDKEFWDKFSRLGGEALFQIGGKTLPAQEKGEITSFIPRGSKTDESNVKSLDTMYTKLYNESAAEIAAQAKARGIAITDAQIKAYINSQLSGGGEWK